MTIAIQPATAAVAQTFRLQLDARPPVGEPWSFLRFFPRTLKVHQGDTVNAAWDGVGTPHTAGSYFLGYPDWKTPACIQPSHRQF